MKSWIKVLDKRVKDLETELTQEEHLLQDKSFENDLSRPDYETYLELSHYNIELIKWRTEDLKHTRRKCLDLVSSNALSTLIKRVQEVGINALNTIEQRHIMFMTLERVSVKTDRNGRIIIDELSFRKIPIPYLIKNA
jgi:5-methylcytosine-specific restriction endonuclease McrBC GTP-binding regulatory subunit McrB